MVKKIKDKEENKIISGTYLPKPIFAYTLIALLLITGIISFWYADGLKVIQQQWYKLVTSQISLEIHPEKTSLPADGTSQLFIDLIAKNKKGQLMEGSEISCTILSGATYITNTGTDNLPINVSKRIILKSPAIPQIIKLEFTYKGLTKYLDITAFDAKPPIKPIIQDPIDNAIVTTATPKISGKADTNLKIGIYIDGKLNTVSDTAKDGTFAIPLTQAISRGKHKLNAVSINQYDVKSEFSATLTIEIKTTDPEIDFSNIRIKPNPVKAGESIYLFIPVSSDTKSISVTLDNANYLLKDRNNSSVFSGVLRAPKSAGIYQLTGLITNQAGENILASNLGSIKVQ